MTIDATKRAVSLMRDSTECSGAHWRTSELESSIYHDLDITNDDPKPFVWTKTADHILANVARFCKRTSETVH